MSQLFKELPIEFEQAALVDGSRIGAFFLKLLCRSLRQIGGNRDYLPGVCLE